MGPRSIYYDALNSQRVSHYSRSLALSEPSFRGMYSVGEPTKTGFVSGYMATVPPEWQALLGGPAITGQCCIPIVTRTSWGPGAFAWNPADLGQVIPAPVTPLLYYTGDHATLGHWSGADAVYGATTQMGGVAIIAGTRTALFLGRNGSGPFCYGNGTGNMSLAGTHGADGEIYCYDPTSDDKGQHAYPYNYQIWAYDLNDFAAVKAGQKQPWEIVPYGVWPLSLPTPEPLAQIGGVGYDAARQIVYISQLRADQDGYAYRPLIHALKIASVATTTGGDGPAAGVGSAGHDRGAHIEQDRTTDVRHDHHLDGGGDRRHRALSVQMARLHRHVEGGQQLDDVELLRVDTHQRQPRCESECLGAEREQHGERRGTVAGNAVSDHLDDAG